MAMSTVYTDSLSRAGSGHSGSEASQDLGERHVRAVFVNVRPDNYDADVAAAFSRLGAEYVDLTSRLFNHDPAFDVGDRNAGGTDR